jgi:hypothetical protein
MADAKVCVFGTVLLSDKTKFRPNKRCLDCPFFEEGLCWCRYLRKKIVEWDHNDDCPVVEIIVEEE